MRFDARRDRRVGRQHRVPCTLRRRLSLTLRRALDKPARVPGRLDVAAAIEAGKRPFAATAARATRRARFCSEV